MGTTWWQAVLVVLSFLVLAGLVGMFLGWIETFERSCPQCREEFGKDAKNNFCHH